MGTPYRIAMNSAETGVDLSPYRVEARERVVAALETWLEFADDRGTPRMDARAVSEKTATLVLTNDGWEPLK